MVAHADHGGHPRPEARAACALGLVSRSPDARARRPVSAATACGASRARAFARGAGARIGSDEVARARPPPVRASARAEATLGEAGRSRSWACAFSRQALASVSPASQSILLADQPLDFVDVFLVGGGDDRNRDAGFAGAPGAADPMHIILRMRGNIEIEHMAHVRDIEAAGGDVRANDEVHVAALERIERGHAGALIHVAVQGARH